MTPDPSEPGLTAALRVGMRIVLRHRLPGGELTDSVGACVAADPATLTVRTRRGDIVVRRTDVVAGKEVPPAPVRRSRPHLAVSMTDLQELMVGGMPPLEQQWLGRWLLRAADGFTGRANSLLPLGEPGLPLDAALGTVQEWYAARGLPPLVQLFGPVGFDIGEDALGRWMLGRGWRVRPRTLVMTAPVQVLDNDATPDVVSAHDRLDAPWLSGATLREQERADTLRSLLDQIRDSTYLVARVDGQVAAVGRVACTAGWAGIFSVHVLPGYRRRGLARAVLAAAGREAARRGARSAYLQVAAGNEPAVTLYRALGFDVHHEYCYAQAE